METEKYTCAKPYEVQACARCPTYIILTSNNMLSAADMQHDLIHILKEYRLPSKGLIAWKCHMKPTIPMYKDI